jgi:hypothetical protein
MKTDDLIRALAVDGGHRRISFNTAMTLALVGGAAASTLIFALLMGPRQDFAAALANIRFPFKVIVVSLLLLAGLGLVSRAGRPGAQVFSFAVLAIVAIALLLTGAATELFVLPRSEWLANLKGSNRILCLILIPALALLPLAATLIGLRYGAPQRPALAGGLAGLAAGGIGATLYALNCDNDSPLFVATWYPIAIGVVVVAGTFAGARLLRW